MTRKRIADKDPVLSPESAASAAPVKAPAAAKAPAVKKARAPRPSANAVTHRRKKSQGEVTPSPVEAVESTPTAATTETVVATVEIAKSIPVPAHEEIAMRAYLLAESRGFSHGSPEQDWLEAERQLLAERGLA